MRAQNRTRLIAAAILLLVFSTGAVASASVLARGSSDAATRAVRLSGSLPDLDAIGLSEDQSRAIDSLLASRQPQIDSIIQGALEDLRQVLDSVDGEIRVRLSPEQLESYERLRAETSGVQAVRRTLSPDGGLSVDTIR